MAREATYNHMIPYGNEALEKLRADVEAGVTEVQNEMFYRLWSKLTIKTMKVKAKNEELCRCGKCGKEFELFDRFVNSKDRENNASRFCLRCADIAVAEILEEKGYRIPNDKFKGENKYKIEPEHKWTETNGIRVGERTNANTKSLYMTYECEIHQIAEKEFNGELKHPVLVHFRRRRDGQENTCKPFTNMSKVDLVCSGCGIRQSDCRESFYSSYGHGDTSTKELRGTYNRKTDTTEYHWCSKCSEKLVKELLFDYGIINERSARVVKKKKQKKANVKIQVRTHPNKVEHLIPEYETELNEIFQEQERVGNFIHKWVPWMGNGTTVPGNVLVSVSPSAANKATCPVCGGTFKNKEVAVQSIKDNKYKILWHIDCADKVAARVLDAANVVLPESHRSLLEEELRLQKQVVPVMLKAQPSRYIKVPEKADSKNNNGKVKGHSSTLSPIEAINLLKEDRNYLYDELIRLNKASAQDNEEVKKGKMAESLFMQHEAIRKEQTKAARAEIKRIDSEIEEHKKTIQGEILRSQRLAQKAKEESEEKSDKVTVNTEISKATENSKDTDAGANNESKKTLTTAERVAYVREERRKYREKSSNAKKNVLAKKELKALKEGRNTNTSSNKIGEMSELDKIREETIARLEKEIAEQKKAMGITS